MKQSVKFAAAMGALTLALTACAGNGNVAQQSDGAKAELPFKACAVSDTGGWQDKSFNQSAYDGLMEAKSFLGVTVDTAESDTVEDFTNNVEKMVADSCTLIIGVGFHLEPAIHESALKHTDRNYALIDSGFSDGTNPVVLENGRPLLFNTSEAAYLAGYASAAMTKTGKVATFGGAQIPAVTVFMDGFADGVNAYNQAKGASVQVLGWDKEAQTGAFTDSFDDQSLGLQQAQQFISEGADIIMPVAGPVGLGAAAAAKSNGNTLIVGVDTDWYEANPQYSSIVLTSVRKEIGAAVEQAIQDSTKGKFTSDPYVGTLANGGVSLAPFHDFEARVPMEVKQDISKLTEQIKKGTLVIESENAPKYAFWPLAGGQMIT